MKRKRMVLVAELIFVIVGISCLVMRGCKGRDDEIRTVKNVWIEEAHDGRAVCYYDGQVYEYECELKQNEYIMDCMADITIQGDYIKAMALKNSRIQGKVLGIGSDYIEIEGYGRVPSDSDMQVYKKINEITQSSRGEIIVGYSQQEFIVANGSICGAVINRELTVDNVRVLIKTTGYTDIFHKEVTLSSTAPMKVENIDRGKVVSELQVAAGDTLLVSSESGGFERIRITVESGEIALDGVGRSQGTPTYEGSIEVIKDDAGFVIVNEVDVEKYLKRVVPSEMPYSYGVEALKVQAVCARSYVYTQLNNDTYAKYGAHVDDSVQYQVYNNTVEWEASNQAIKETSHQILLYNNMPAKTFYYSTSWGRTSDCSLWGSDKSTYPYYEPCIVTGGDATANVADVSVEENFIEAIGSENPNDYDYTFPMYRWSMSVPVDVYSGNVIRKINERVKSLPKKNQVSGELKGRITGVETVKRSSGGALMELMITFEKGTARISSENNIRYIMGYYEGALIDKAGKARNMDSLPSGYCYFSLEGDSVKCVGGGWGHGIGMSQNAVRTMVESGISYSDVLSFFYPGTTLSVVEASLQK